MCNCFFVVIIIHNEHFCTRTHTFKGSQYDNYAYIHTHTNQCLSRCEDMIIIHTYIHTHAHTVRNTGAFSFLLTFLLLAVTLSPVTEMAIEIVATVPLSAVLNSFGMYVYDVFYYVYVFCKISSFFSCLMCCVCLKFALRCAKGIYMYMICTRCV